jgi:DNA-binding transcriptional MerR regulator
VHTGLFIGDVAARAGVSIHTVRFYERRRLLPPSRRTGGGMRVFAPEAVERIRFIKQAQSIGFTLDEIRELLASGDGEDECRRVHDLLVEKLADLDERISNASKFRRQLVRHFEACVRELSEHGEAARCPLIIKIAQAADPAKI